MICEVMNNDKTEPQSLAAFSSMMKRDWDDRAKENARWYINTHSIEQTDEEFDLTGKRDFDGVVSPDLALLTDGRDPVALRVLEIGCGAGRMTRFLAETFGEVYGVDVSGEMIRLAQDRLSHLRNVYFKETNGVDFAVFPEDFFDVIFSAYVFQHAPDPQVIESNIRDAYRVLKPRGVFKFVVSAIKHADYVQMQKDTWSGAAFPESSIRRLSEEMGAQLLGVVGDGTQYCWSLLRKRSLPIDRSPASFFSPEILTVGRADNLAHRDLAPRTEDFYLGTILRGVNYESVDIANVSIEFRGRSLAPCYVGPVGVDAENFIRRQKSSRSENDHIQINVRIPGDEPAGEGDLLARLPGGVVSNAVTISLPPVLKGQPRILVIANAVDTGLDIYAEGAKSRIRILVDQIGERLKAEDVGVKVNDDWIKPETMKFVPEKSFWEITVQLPVGISPGEATLQVRVGDLSSSPSIITIK
jgi:SAM-dependent methyltransferase